MPDREEHTRIDRGIKQDALSEQAGLFLDAVAPALATACDPFISFGQPIPPADDLSRGATLTRIAWLDCLVQVAAEPEDVDAAVMALEARLPRVANLRQASEQERREIEALAAIADSALAFGPRRVLGSVPPLGGRGLEQAEAEGRGVGALLPRGDQDGAA